VLAEQNITQEFWNDYYKATDALRISLLSILGDDGVANKGPMVEQSLNEFADHIEQMLPGPVGKSLAASVAAMFAGTPGPTQTDQGDTMSALTKHLGLADNASEADIMKALEARDTAAASLVEKMTDAQVTYLAKLRVPASREDFVKAKSADRDKKMADKPDGDGAEDDVEKSLKSGDAFKSVDGALILKSKVGAETFAILKSMDDGRRADRAEIEKAREKVTTTEFEKRATDMGFDASFGATIRKAYGGDAAAQAEVEKQMAALRKQAETGGAFSEFGARGVAKAGSAEAEIIAKRDELLKANPKLSPEQAYARVYKARENVDLVKRFRAETAEGNA
jgi:hypothetical protein